MIINNFIIEDFFYLVIINQKKAGEKPAVIPKNGMFMPTDRNI